jgi:hypothetical protein
MAERKEGGLWRYAIVGIAAFLFGRDTADNGQQQPAYLATSPAPTVADAPMPFVADDPEPVEAPAPFMDSAYYANCSAARAAGAAPVRMGDPGYAPHLDRDRDGVGCE